MKRIEATIPGHAANDAAEALREIGIKDVQAVSCRDYNTNLENIKQGIYPPSFITPYKESIKLCFQVHDDSEQLAIDTLIKSLGNTKHGSIAVLPLSRLINISDNREVEIKPLSNISESSTKRISTTVRTKAGL